MHSIVASEGLETRTKDFERVMIVKALQHMDGRRIEAANQLGVGRKYANAEDSRDGY